MNTIIFTLTVKECNAVYNFLSTKAFLVFQYNGKLTRNKKFAALAAIQDAIKSDQIFIVVATSALGLGIHIPKIVRVIHFTIPPTISVYIQHSNRAARTQRGTSITFFNWGDSNRAKKFVVDLQDFY